MRNSYIGILLMLISGCAFAVGSNDGWTEVTKGVFQKTEMDGSITTMAYGAEGAAYDRARLQQIVDDLRMKISDGNSTADDARALGDSLNAMDGIPAWITTNVNAGKVTPKASISSTVCGYPYQFDSHLVVGAVGATAVARAGVFYQQFAPLPPPLTSSFTYTSATVTPYRGTPITRTNSLSSSQGTPLVIEADYLPAYSSYAPSCTASTFSYIQVTARNCSGSAGYVSQSRNYSTCVSTP